MPRVVSDVDSRRPDFIPWWRTEVTPAERDSVQQALLNEQVSMGAVTAQLERDLADALDIPYVVATTSGTVALTLAMMALGIGPGDEVIVPDRTFIATAHGAHILGAKIVLADCLADSPNVDPAEIEKLITSRTKAIVPVHLNGRFCRLGEILAIADRHGIPVIEDAAQAVFSATPQGFMGGFGRLGCFSFGMTKLISTGQGGAVLTRDRAIYDNLRALRNHGVRDVVSHEYLQSGHNFKFTDLQAALGRGQVGRWREKVAHCNLVYETYRHGLAGQSQVQLVPVDVAAGECSLWAEAVVDQRDDFMAYLAERGVQTRTFLPCLHSAPHLTSDRPFPNSQSFDRRGLILPSGPAQPLANVERSLAVIRDWVAVNARASEERGR